MKNGIIGFTVGIAICLVGLWLREQGQNGRIDQLSADLAAAKLQRAAAIETVTVHVPVLQAATRESERLGTIVTLAGPTTISVRLTPTSAPELVQVPALVVKKMRADSIAIVESQRHIAYLYSVLRADSVVILAADSIITKLRHPRCGTKCKVLIGAGAGEAARRILTSWLRPP